MFTKIKYYFSRHKTLKVDALCDEKAQLNKTIVDLREELHQTVSSYTRCRTALMGLQREKEHFAEKLGKAIINKLLK